MLDASPQLMTVAFVLSGGASLGAAQAGMLQALYERGIRPDLVVGTSVGAINAAFIASHPPTLRTAYELQRIWRGLSRGQVFPANPVTATLGFLGLRNHFISAGSLRRLVSRHVPIARLENAEVALHVVATDVMTGTEVLLSTGSVVDAVLASAAIPGIFPPIERGSQLLMDGAIANNTPISQAVKLGADRVIVLQAIRAGRLTRAPRGVLAAGLSAVSHALTHRFLEDLRRYSSVAELTILPAPAADGILPTDFGHTDHLIAEGLRGARMILADENGVVQLARAA
jgi:NTE family protein